MRRDMDLVRQILLQISKADCEQDASVFVDDKYDFKTIAYHFQIMREAGLIEANIQKSFGGEYVIAEAVQLTWEGNDFLSSVSNSKVWEKVKTDIAKHSIDAPFAIVKQLAISACSSLFGLT